MVLWANTPNAEADPMAPGFPEDRQTADVSRVVITSAAPDAELATFGDKAAGARIYRLEFVAVQNLHMDTLWRTVWEHAGEVVPVELYPEGYGQREEFWRSKFTMDAVVSEPDGDILGGDANPSPSARFSFACSWALQAKPVMTDI